VPKQIYQIKDFSGGLNTLKDPADIQDNEQQTVSNLTVNLQGSLTPSYSNTDATNNKISGYSNTNITEVEPGYGLGYFETDNVRDAVEVSQTSSITGDDNNEGSATGFIVRVNGGAYKELEYKVGGSQQNLASSFPVGSRILLTATSFSADGFDPNGQGVYEVVDHNSNNIVVDRTIPFTIETEPQDFWPATIKGFNKGELLLLLANPATHKIDVYSRFTAGTNWSSNAITLRSSATSIASKVLYYAIDEAIRCCDTATGNSCQIQWYGWIQRRHFDAASSSTDLNSYMGYYAKDNTLAPPTTTLFASESVSSPTNNTTYPGAGTGFRTSISTHTDVDGAIIDGVYEFAETFIYDGNQESLPTLYTTTHTISTANTMKSLSVNISTKGPFDPRISGGRIYIREKDKDRDWTMLVDIDLTKGCRTKFSEEYTVWHDAGSSQYNCPTATATANFEIKELGFMTFENLNGYSSATFSNAIGDSGEHWKDSVIANNRVFVCNPTIKDENTGSTKALATLTNFKDRIMYSMPNRFDTFPYENYIEASKGDNEEYIALEAYADRLLAFKDYSVDIINIASGDDANWFLEDSKKYMGVQNHNCVCKTQYGIVWINNQGLFLYNGNQITNLSERKLAPTTISDNIGTNTALIYDEKDSLLYIIESLSSNGSGFIFDMKKGTFVSVTAFLDITNDGNTNPVDTNNNVLIAHDEGSQVDFFQFYRSYVAKTSDLITKEFDFGDPSRSKKVYAVYITYKSDDVLTGYFELIEGGTTHSLSGTVGASASNWANVKLTPSAPITCSKVALKMDTGANNRKVYINDIGIEYRMLYKRSS